MIGNNGWYVAKETLHAILKALDTTFRNVVPEFEDFVVASRNDIEEVYALLIMGLGWMKRIGMDDWL